LRTVFRKTAQDTGGGLLQVAWIGDPGWTTGPDHVHPHQEERFEVLSGKLGLRVEGIERIHGAGEVIVATAGSAHAAWNASSDDEVHVLVDFRPALRTEVAFETLAGLARAGKTNKAGAPRTRYCWHSSCTTTRTEYISSDPRWPSRGGSSGRSPRSRVCSGIEPNTTTPMPGEVRPPGQGCNPTRHRESRLRKPVELLERRADGVLVSGVCRPRGRLPAARGP
ncbi:MAG TPA: cupin domain-containing protein, partial [Rubrobacter sp.]|nr:cupin domain-containing protein [Rubrobacter sp.]